MDFIIAQADLFIFNTLESESMKNYSWIKIKVLPRLKG